MKLNKLLNGVPEIPGLDKWTAALGGDSTLSNGVFHGLKQAPQPEPEKQKGKWVPANCWVDCGSKCFNKAYVEDGFLTRQGSDETHEDDPDFPQARSCARGRMRRHEVFGSDRLKYPMRRRNWKPGGGKKELRGRDEWVMGDG